MRRVKSFSAGNEFAQIELEDGTRWRIRRGDDWDGPCPGDAPSAQATEIIGLECDVQTLRNELSSMASQAEDEQYARANIAERKLAATEPAFVPENELRQVWEAIRDLARSAISDPHGSFSYEDNLRRKREFARVRAKAEAIVGRGE